MAYSDGINSDSMYMLRDETRCISLEMQRRLDEVESYVGRQCVNFYGDLTRFTDEQIRYLETAGVITADKDTAESLRHYGTPTDEFPEVFTLESKSLNGGYRYRDEGDPAFIARTPLLEEDQAEDDEFAEGIRGFLLPQGRIPVYIMKPDFEIDIKYLTEDHSEVNIDWVWGHKLGLTETMARMKQLNIKQHTIDFAGIMLHEKIHGLHVWELPEPIREAVAEYYKSALFKYLGWDHTTTPWTDLITDWGNLRAELGADLDQYIFGNLNKPLRMAEIQYELQKRYTLEKISQLCPEIQWTYTEDTTSSSQ
jgi:hypothetical protein